MKTLSFDEKKLARMQQQAMMGELSESVIHETKNLVAIMLARTQQLIRNHGNTPELNAIEEAARQCGNLLVSWLGLLPNSTTLQWTSFSKILDKVLIILHKELEIQEITLDLDVQSIGNIEVPDQYVTPLLLNLLMNAMKAIQAEKPKLPRISVQGRMNEAFVEIQIHDNGMGMDEKTAAAIFNKSVSNFPEGFGLGLFVCHQIMQQMSGEITATGEPHQGATFALKIPRNALENLRKETES